MGRQHYIGIRGFEPETGTPSPLSRPWPRFTTPVPRDPSPPHHLYNQPFPNLAPLFPEDGSSMYFHNPSETNAVEKGRVEQSE
jgi:hypothetical protein